MTDPGLHARLSHRVHPGLTIDVEFRVGVDECVVLFGPSGAGKSTILKLIAGLIRPRSGSVRLGESTLSDASSKTHRPLRDRRIGLIFQDDLLFPHLDVAKNVGFGFGRRRDAESDARLAAVAESCGIGHLLGRSPATLSGGERQRVGLARALAPRPRLLLCDEPVSALDLDARHALLARIGRIRRRESIPVVFVTHSPDEAIAVGTRLLALEAGRIVAEGPPLAVLSERGPSGSFRLRNVFEASVEGFEGDGHSTVLRIVGGPRLVVAGRVGEVGDRVDVEVEADEIVLARGPVGELSARNTIAGTVERVACHGGDAEVFVRTGGVSWVVGVIAGAIGALGLIGGAEVLMIVKARSCRVLIDPRSPDRTRPDRR